jgi:phospholipid transport system substrate-binding protein
MTNCNTGSLPGFTPNHVTVPRECPDQLRQTTHEAALEFGRYCMLLRQRQLIADGEPVKLSTRSLDLLLVLLEADGSLVTKEELLCRVWPGIHVSEENLKVQIFALRKAFGEDRDFIRTETGRGYRFTAVVKSTVSRSASLHAAPRWQWQGQRTMSRLGTILAFPKCSHRTTYLPTVRRSRLCKALAFAAGIALSTFSYTSYAALADGGSTVQSLYDALLITMKDGRTLGQSGRFAQLAPVIHRSFDVASMARLSVGPSWIGLSEAQRQELTESYGRYLSATYADRFDSYHGQKLEVTGEQPAAFGLLVTTRIVKSNGEPVEVDYVMRQSGEKWLISDIYLDSAISEVATRRSEFATILKTQGINGLIAALNRKADILTGTTASSF